MPSRRGRARRRWRTSSTRISGRASTSSASSRCARPLALCAAGKGARSPRADPGARRPRPRRAPSSRVACFRRPAPSARAAPSSPRHARPPGGPPPVAGRNEQFRPALRTRRRPGAFFSSSQSLSTDRIRFFSTHASPPIHPPPPRPRLQGILDRNKVLIHEINRAHHTYPWDVHRAAERIRELNANLGKVQELYEEATGGFNAAALSNRRDIRASE